MYKRQGYKLGDVLDKKVTMEEFVAQLSDEDLICIFRGEGMCSPKVTPGTAAAFGGLTPELQEFGIPAACCTDGPSGLRFDCGTRAVSYTHLTDTALEEKMTRVAAILPSLSGLSGELHMEDYKDGDSSFVFSKDV